MRIGEEDQSAGIRLLEGPGMIIIPGGRNLAWAGGCRIVVKERRQMQTMSSWRSLDVGLAPFAKA